MSKRYKKRDPKDWNSEDLLLYVINEHDELATFLESEIRRLIEEAKKVLGSELFEFAISFRHKESGRLLTLSASHEYEGE